MKPFLDALAVVTATCDPVQAEACWQSWVDTATYRWPIYVEANGIPKTSKLWSPCDWEEPAVFRHEAVFLGLHSDPMGSVPAYAEACQRARRDGAQILVCLHDDVEIHQAGWDAQIVQWFNAHQDCLLAGFGGGKGLGAEELYRAPYDPMQLARQDFVSNMRDADAHGRRITAPERVACLDGFCQIGRAEWLAGAFAELRDLGIVHHYYDGAIGCLAKRVGGEAWCLPIACHHYGGRTAVANGQYQTWARTQHPNGDQHFWSRAHEIGYETFRDVLPIRS